ISRRRASEIALNASVVVAERAMALMYAYMGIRQLVFLDRAKKFRATIERNLSRTGAVLCQPLGLHPSARQLPRSVPSGTPSDGPPFAPQQIQVTALTVAGAHQNSERSSETESAASTTTETPDTD
ncbi:MAG: hypothetical protein AAGA03_04970, partial [Planctomycetota bacterium]